MINYFNCRHFSTHWIRRIRKIRRKELWKISISSPCNFINRHEFSHLKKYLEEISLFVGPCPLFQTSDDICTGFQSHCVSPHYSRYLMGSSYSPADLLVASMTHNRFTHLLFQALTRPTESLTDWTGRQHKLTCVGQVIKAKSTTYLQNITLISSFQD